MADGIVGSLKDAWGVEDDGPDPSKLPGLMELAESWLEEEGNDPSEIAHHFETMRNRVVEAHVHRSQAISSGDVTYDPKFVTMVEKNLADMVSVEKALEHFIESSNEGDKEECFEALGELEQSIDAMRESGDAIEAFLKDSPPVCMGCGSIGDEHVCPACGAERLILDPSARSEDERRIQVSDEVLDVYNAYTEVLAGKASMNDLVNSLQSLEFTYLESEAIGEQTLTNKVATDRIKKTANELIAEIRGTLDGIEKMHGVTKTRKIAELTAGWEAILKHTVKSQELLHKLNSQAESL